MKVTIQEQDGNMVAYLEGSLDTAAAPETEKAMQPLYGCEGKDIIIDCAGLEYISSAGLRVILSCYKQMKKSSGTLKIVNVLPAIMEVLEITGFKNIVDISETEVD
jgi:anti-anti-sigma factor